VAGSAVNLPDGAVEVVLEGPPRAVDELIAFCAEGPDRAEVSAVEVTEEEPRGETGFSTG
jgi:acylphosphatase